MADKKRKRNKSVSIRRYKRKKEFNLGIVLFAIVFIYLLVTVISYLGKDNISVYEVREGSIVRDNSYTGLVIREETAVNTDTDGYVSYYQNENSKVKAGARIYALSPKPLSTEEESSQSDSGSGSAISEDVQDAVALQLQNFNENYDAGKFSSVYSLRNEINTVMQDVYSVTRTQQIDSLIQNSGMEVTTGTSPRDGIVAFTVDGYEGLTKDTFTKENFDTTKYDSFQLSDQTKVKAGDPVYRLITSENWSVIVPLDEATAVSLQEDEVSHIRVRVDKDSETMWAGFSLIEKDGDYYGCLDFDNSMIRYAEDRYLNIELILEDESGLKIPKSSVVNEKFYIIPEDYITSGGNSSSKGVMVRKTNGETEFLSLTIYETTDDGEVYVSRDEIDDGTRIVMPDSNETYTIGETKTLQGVYNINKGYAVFKKVNVLCENDEYYIVKEGEDYSLSNYDHIVQNGRSVDQNEVVFQ